MPAKLKQRPITDTRKKDIILNIADCLKSRSGMILGSNRFVRRRKYAHIYYPASPCAACDPRAGISSIPGSRRHEQMASAERIHWKGSPDGCEGRGEA